MAKIRRPMRGWSISTPTGGGSKFKVAFRDRKTGTTHEIADLMLPMPGRHNALERHGGDRGGA